MASLLKWLGTAMRRRLVSVLVMVAAGMLTPVTVQPLVAQSAPAATFRSGIDLVTVNAVVRDRNGRLVTGLGPGDFELFDAGERRPISEFRIEETPVSVALLLDVSGSMDVGPKLHGAREAGQHLLSWLEPGRDEAALFTFDTRLHELQPFTTATGESRGHLGDVTPFGATSLHDAIAETAERLVAHGGRRRAVIVLTDGIDTGSRLSPSEVSGIASAIDVPVYIIIVVAPIDHPHAAAEVAAASSLEDLARWTGGNLFVASVPAHASVAARQIIAELRHQYMMAFPPGTVPGWHPIEVRTRHRDLVVRARSGYFAGQSRQGSPGGGSW